MTGAKGKEVTVVDRFGREKKIPAKNGMFLISLAREPLYIQDITDKLANQVALDMGLPKSFRIGEPNKVTVTVLNQLADKGKGKLTLKAPKGWKVTPDKGLAVTLDPEKGKTTYDFTILPAKGEEGASNPIEASLAQGRTRLASVQQSRPAAITLNLSASFPKTIDPGEKAKLTLRITHNLSEEMWGGIRIKKLPKGWTISPADKKLLTFKPTEREMTAEFEITVPKDIETPYGDHGFRVEATVEGRVAAGQNIGVSLPKLTKNIAPEATVTTPDGLKQQPGRSSSLSANKGDKAINDNDRGTFTQKVVGAKEYLIDFEWKEAREFNAIRIFGAWGCGIQSFDVIADGKKVATIEDLKYVGPITLARFASTKAKKLRLRVFKCLRNAPVIFEIEIYKLAK